MELLRKAYEGMKWEHSKASTDEMLCLEDSFGVEEQELPCMWKTWSLAE